MANARTPVVPASMAMTAPDTPGKLSGQQHLGGDDAHAGVGQGGGGGVAEVEDPAVDVGPSLTSSSTWRPFSETRSMVPSGSSLLAHVQPSWS